MLTINIIKTAKVKTISGTVGTDKFSCNYSDEILEQLKEKQNEFESIKEVEAYEIWVAQVKEIVESKIQNPLEESAVEDIYFNSVKGTYHLKGKNKISKIAIPELLIQKMFDAKDKGLSVIPLVKAWARFLRNPNFSEHKAYLFSKYITAEIIDTDMVDKLVEEEGYTFEAAVARSRFNEVTITNQGLIQTRKYVTLVTEGYEVNEKNEVVKVPLFKTTKTVDKISGVVSEVTDTPEFSEEFYFLPAVQGTGGDAFMCNGNLGHTLQVGHEVYLEKWSQIDVRDEVNCVRGLHSGKQICRLVA